MQVTTWNPLREMEDLFHQVQRGLVRASVRSGAEAAGNVWYPSVDISETSKEYWLKAELPGLTSDQVKVTVDNGLLTLSGERSFSSDHKDEKHHRVERSYGSFSRTFSLPDDVVTEQISADCKDGILKVRLPKAEAKKPEPISIKVQ